MEIQAIWEKGVFRPIAPLKLNRRIVTIKVCEENNATLTTSRRTRHASRRPWPLSRCFRKVPSAS